MHDLHISKDEDKQGVCADGPRILASRNVDIDFEAIKLANPLADVARPYLDKAKKRGRNLVACCPFHDEKTPSFHIYTADQRYHCFGCGAHGDVFDFLYHIERLDLKAAVQKLTNGTTEIDQAAIERLRAAQKAAEQRQAQEAAEASAKAKLRWEAATSQISWHDYLDRKSIDQHGARLEGNNLLVPLFDMDGQLMSVQAIAPDGQKKFAVDAPVVGGHYVIGATDIKEALNSGKPVLLCEGFATGASLHEATGLATVCTFSGSNLKAVAAKITDTFGTGKAIIVCGDDDASKPDNMGRKYAEEAAEILSAKSAFPKFLIAGNGTDFNDMAKHSGKDAVARVVEEALNSEGQWKGIEPVDLWGKFKLPDYPRYLLPKVIDDWAVAVSQQIGCDPAGLAVSALAICAMAISDEIRVKVRKHQDWYESARIWVALVGPPSTKKSPIQIAAKAPLVRIEKRLLREYQEAKRAYDNLPKEEREQVEPPVRQRITIDDATVEGAQNVFKDVTRGIGLVHDELSGWFGAMDKHNAGKGAMADRSLWIRSYGGGSYQIDRVSRGSIFIENLSLSLLGNIQPEPIRAIAKDTQDDGLLQRLLMVTLAPATRSADVYADDEREAYSDLVERLYRMRPAGIIKPQPLEFSLDASIIRDEVEDRNRNLQAIEFINPKLASHIGKYDGLFARLCVLWHCIENDDRELPPIKISGETAAAVRDFMYGFLLPHALSAYVDMFGYSDADEAIADIAGYILARGMTTISTRDIARGSRVMRALTGWRLQAALERLEVMGWILPDASRSGGGARFVVNPKVHELYRDRASAEALRRQNAMEIIRQLSGGDE